MPDINPAPRQCEFASLLDGSKRCTADAGFRCWSDAPGMHDSPSLECAYHAGVFRKMIAKYYPGFTAHTEPLN